MPAADRFQRVIEPGEDDFRFDPAYPDLRSARTSDFVLIEILWSVGRSVKVKKQLLHELMQSLAAGPPRSGERDGLLQGNVVGDWAFRGGRLIRT